MSFKHTPRGIDGLGPFVTACPTERRPITVIGSAIIDVEGARARLGSAAPPRVIDVWNAGEFATAHVAGVSSPDPIVR